MRQLAVTERDNPGHAAAIRPPGFVGREREMAALDGALAGPSAVVLIEGEAGVGKTRLVREFLAAAEGHRAGVLVACCPPFRQPHTLGPVVDAVREAAGDVRELGLSGLAGALRPVLPEWASVLPATPEPLEDASAARHRVFRALAEFLDRLDVRLLVTEDAHWADETTLEFLLFLAARQPRRVSLLVTCRPEDTPTGSLLLRLTRLAAGTDGLRLTLHPLDVAQTRSLVSSMLAGEQVSEQFAAFVHERTEGLPLAVEESVRLMGDRADLTFRHASWARRHLTDIEVPPTVRDAVLERAAQLSSEAVAVLRAAAVLGEPAGEPVLALVAGLARDEAWAGLSEVLGCGLVIENRSSKGQTVVFRHALAARAVYDAIPAPLRRDMHQLAGQALQDATPVPLARLAHHFREAGDATKWCQYAEQAADQALSVGDQATAAVLLQNLVTDAGLPADVVVRLARRIPLVALAGYGSLTTLIHRLRSLLEDAALSPGERAEVGFQLGRLLVNAGEDEAGMAELERAVPGLAHRPVDAARAMTLLGLPRRTLWPVAVHRRWVERGWAVARDGSISDDDRLVLAINRAGALLELGEGAGWAAAAELPADASDPRQALQVARNLINTGEAAIGWGRYGDARQRTRAALEVADRYGFPRMHGVALAQLAHLDWLTGGWSGLAERTATLTGHEEPQARMQALLIGGLLDAAAGASVAAEKKLRLVLEEKRRRGMAVLLSLEPAAALARLRLAEGEAGEALALTDRPVEVITAKGIWLWATEVVPARVQALAAMGRTAEAEALVGAFARGLRGRDLPAPGAALVFCRAVLAEAIGEHRRAAAAFVRVVAAWQELPRPYDALLAEERQAQCLLALGQDQEGLDLLPQVFRALSALGARADAARVMKALRGHGVTGTTGRPGRRSYGDELSPRELEVVRLLAAGQTNRQIAVTLFLSVPTVIHHVKSARRKLDAPSRTALAVIAAESGLLASAEDTARA
jgi:DNA-binding CsgD family transcriptional regulator